MKQTWVSRFLKQAEERPNNTAVMDFRGVWTYRTMNRRSAFLAERILRETGGKPVRVALLMPRVRDFVLCQLAVLRAGCAMVPIDGEYPAERVRSILEDSGCALCLTTAARAGDAAGVKTLLPEEPTWEVIV